MRSFVSNQPAASNSVAEATTTGYAPAANPPTHPAPPAASALTGPGTAPVPSAAVVPSAPQSVVVGSSAYVEGEISRSDIKTPYLSCVQAVGPKSLLHTPGTIVLGESAISAAPAPQQPTTKLRVLFCRASKTYVEALAYNPAPTAPRPKVFRTQAEVAALGGTTEWIGGTAPTYMPRLSCLMLIRSPEALDDSAFSIIADDKTYAPSMLMLQKTSYSAAKTLLTDLSLSLKNDPTATFYDLFWVREQKGQNWVWVAKLVRARDERPSDELRSIARKMSGGTIEVVDEEGTV